MIISAIKQKTKELAFGNPEWFDKLSYNQQKKYVEENPSTKYKPKDRKQAQKEAHEERRQKKKDTTSPNDAKRELKNEGSPTNFTGPKNKRTSVSGKPNLERKIVTNLKKLAQISKEAKDSGGKAPNVDLCKVSIPGTNLFCQKNKGIPRNEMPQLKAFPKPGSDADIHLKKNSEGEVDAEPLFKAHLQKKGITIKKKSVPASMLKATQKDLVGAKVAGMLEALKNDPTHEKITAPILVSRDGYILDGHHRWAAMVGLDMAGGTDKSVMMPVEVVDMDIESLVKESNDFGNEIGLQRKPGSATKNMNEKKPSHKRDTHELDKAVKRKEKSNFIDEVKLELASEFPRTYRLIYGIRGLGELPAYAFFNVSKQDVEANLDKIKNALANRVGANKNEIFVFLVNGKNEIVWSESGDVGDPLEYDMYDIDYDADDMCDCGCLGNGDCDENVENANVETASRLTQEQFDKWDVSRQRKYLNEHPNSKFNKNRSSAPASENKTAKSTKDKKPEVEKIPNAAEARKIQREINKEKLKKAGKLKVTRSTKIPHNASGITWYEAKDLTTVKPDSKKNAYWYKKYVPTGKDFVAYKKKKEDIERSIDKRSNDIYKLAKIIQTNEKLLHEAMKSNSKQSIEDAENLKNQLKKQAHEMRQRHMDRADERMELDKIYRLLDNAFVYDYIKEKQDKNTKSKATKKTVDKTKKPVRKQSKNMSEVEREKYVDAYYKADIDYMRLMNHTFKTFKEKGWNPRDIENMPKEAQQMWKKFQKADKDLEKLRQKAGILRD